VTGIGWVAGLLSAINAVAVTNQVASIGALQAAINAAAPGDAIVLANGVYLNNTINIATSDIVVQATTPGGVFLNGTNAITISGDRVVFSGFQFTSGTMAGIPIQVSGSQNRLTQLNFDGYSAQKYINIQAPSRSNEVTYCNFRNKPATAPPGNLVHFGADESVVGYHQIRYCSFRDMPGGGGDNGNECIRLSNGAQSNYIARTVVEYCYFNSTGPGDSEAVSIKCRENIIRYCTFTNNQNAMLVFRNGNDNIAYGNFFISAGGIRVKEANNIYCYNNYFANSGVGGTMDAIKLDYVSPNCSNINFLHNLFVECGNIDLGGAGPKTNTWANNIFKKSSGNIFLNANTGTTWLGNIRTGSLGITIASGITNTNPQLVLNSHGYYGLASNSPAIDAASASYPSIPNILNVDDDPSLLLDISGQSRPASKTLKDVGCDEYGTNGLLNRPLALSDVGPVYLGGPSGIVAPAITSQSLSQTVNAGSPASFWIAVSGTAPLSYQWRKDGMNLVGAITATNTIPAAQAANAGNYSVVVTNGAGSITSAVASLTVNLPPGIEIQPQSQAVIEGSPLSLFVAVTGTAPFSYQWRKDGTNLAGSITATNSIASVQGVDAGNYTVVVTNVAGSLTSAVATVTVEAPPAILVEPESQTVSAGSPAVLWVRAAGSAPLTYQWRKDGTSISGATDATNALAAAQSVNAGSYTVVVTNVAGSLTSAVAQLTVTIVPPQITSAVLGGNGSFVLSGTGPIGERYRILAVTNAESPLISLPTVGTGVFSGGIFSFTDDPTTNHSQRLYRVATP
jgi:hypothetical protein